MTSALTGWAPVGRTFPLYMSGTALTLAPNTHDRVLFTGGAPGTLTLPSCASSPAGYELKIKNTTANTLTVNSVGTDYIGISTATTSSLTSGLGLTLICQHVSPNNRWQIEFGPA